MLEPRSCASTPPLPIPDTYNTGFSCIAPSSYLRLPECCLPWATTYQAADHCFQWCHTSQDWNSTSSYYPLATFDIGNTTTTNDTERLRLSFKACLAANGTTVADSDVACQQDSQDTIPSSYNFFGPNNISCNLVTPSTGVGLIPESGPTCGMPFIGNPDGSGNNTSTFDHCCGWSPRKLDVSKCYEYCDLPRGNSFRGKGNLTGVEALGSFKKCMLNNGGGAKALDSVYCTWNQTVVDIQGYNVTTAAYLDASSRHSPSLYWIALCSVVVAVLLGLFVG